MLQARGTSLQYIKDRMHSSPINALQNRTSAHFTEINSMYMQHMAKNLLTHIDGLEKEWENTSEQERKTRYARPGYKFIAAHSNAK